MLLCKEFLSRIYRKLFRKILFPLTGWIFPRFRIRKDRIVFDNFGGKGYAENPKYIAEEMHSRGLPFELIWLVDNAGRYEMPSYIRQVKMDSFRGMAARATAKVWVDNIRNLHPIKKKEQQIYLQTWHAPVSLKKIEKDAEAELGADYCREAQYDGQITDGIIVNDELQEKQFRRAFWLNEKAEYLRIGMPRYDYLMQHREDTSISNQLKEKYHLDPEAYTILFAPTFRDDGSLDGYMLDFERLIEAFKERLQRKVTLIVRLHPNVKQNEAGIRYTPEIIDGSIFRDPQELAFISDCIISDYSTSIFEFLLLDKPVFICALDLKAYEKLRGLLPEFYELPFPVAETNDDLIRNIRAYDEKTYGEKVTQYLQTHPMYDDGHASERAVDWICAKAGD